MGLGAMPGDPAESASAVAVVCVTPSLPERADSHDGWLPPIASPRATRLAPSVGCCYGEVMETSSEISQGTRVEFTEPMGGVRRINGQEVIAPKHVQGVVLRESEIHPGHFDIYTDETVGQFCAFDCVDVPFAHPSQFVIVNPDGSPR
jgi:hypothetical protein